MIGISLNTYDLDDEAAKAAIARRRGNRIAVHDPVRYDSAPLIDAILAAKESLTK